MIQYFIKNLKMWFANKKENKNNQFSPCESVTNIIICI